MTPIHELRETVLSLSGATFLMTALVITYAAALLVRTLVFGLRHGMRHRAVPVAALASVGLALAGLSMAWPYSQAGMFLAPGTVVDLVSNAVTGFGNLAPENGMDTAARVEWIHDAMALVAAVCGGWLVLGGAAGLAFTGSLIERTDAIRAVFQPKPETTEAH